MKIDRKSLFTEKYKYKIERTEPKIKGIKISNNHTTQEFREYVDYLRERTKQLHNIMTAKFIGRYSKYIENELKEELDRLKETTMMVHKERSLGQVSTRGTHIYNAANIAQQISRGIFDDDEVAKGIGLATLLHDLGQPSFGHEGENISSKVSNKKHSGPRPHNATGATQILFRSSPKIRRGISEGIAVDVISIEARNRDIPIDMLTQSLKEGKEPMLQEKIAKEVKKQEGRILEAIQLLAVSAGTHNGERGTANINPNHRIRFEDFYRVLEKCFIYQGADKEMQSLNMIDAIVKISDQISSIPYDMIDGKKGGIVIDIPDSYIDPVSQILGADKEEIRKRLNSDNEELNKLVIEIQKKLVQSLIKSSSKYAIRMDLDSLLYGRKDKTGQTIVQGLRMPTYAEYLPYTSSEKETEIMQEAWYNCTQQLSNEILEPNGMFPRQLNAIFRMEQDDPRRQIYQEGLKRQYRGREEFKDFFDYILQTSPQEYNFIKANCHEYGVNKIREKLLSAKEKFMNNTAQYKNENEGEIEQGILNYMFISNKGIPEPLDGKEYTDNEINEIYKSINAMRQIQGKKKLLLERDERIATQLALGYIEYRFNDKTFIDFCVSIGAMTEEQANVVRTPYDPVLKSKYIPDSVKAAAIAYAEAENYDEQEI